MWRLVVRPQVEDDLVEASLWYDKKQIGLGDQFLAEYVAAYLSYRGEPMAVLDSRQWSPPLLDQTILLHHSFCGRRRTDHRDRCDECCKGRLKFDASASLKGSHTFENAVAALAGHRLGNDPNEHPQAEGRASRRPGRS